MFPLISQRAFYVIIWQLASGTLHSLFEDKFGSDDSYCQLLGDIRWVGKKDGGTAILHVCVCLCVCEGGRERERERERKREREKEFLWVSSNYNFLASLTTALVAK